MPGYLWELDRYYSGGRQISDGEIVGGTQDPELFLSQRYGNFSYRFPVPPGKYTLRLLFAETFFGPHNRGKGGPGSRIFNVRTAAARRCCTISRSSRRPANGVPSKRYSTD